MENQIQFTQLTHIVHLQNEAEKQMLAEFASGVYTVENPLVELNPYLIAPLTAMVLFTTPSACEVTVVVRGKEHAGDISHTFPSDTKHILPVYGLYPASDNIVDIYLSSGEAKRLEITTAALDPMVPATTYCKANAKYMRNNMIFLTPTSKAHPIACDYKGDVRWYLTLKVSFDMKRLKNGHLLVGTDRLVGAPYYVSGTYEMAVSGKIFKEFRLPGAYHHDTFELDDGNILMLSQEPNAHTVEDTLVLVDRNDGSIIKTWDFKKDMLTHVGGSGSYSEHDWFHSNSVVFDKNTNTIIVSGRHQDAVIGFDFETGDLKWVISDPESWPKEFTDKYFFKPIGESFEWSYEQHGLAITPDGDVMMFDNGHYRSKIKENYILNADNYSRGVRYRLNTDDMTIEQVWQFGKERGADFFSPYICNVEYYNEGHYMVHSGGVAYLDGKPLEGLGSFEKNGPNGDRVTLNSVTCEIVNDEVVYELHTAANYFRAEKLPLYYAHETCELGDGLLLGSLGVTQEMDTDVPAEPTGELIPEHYQLSVKEDVDRIVVNGTYEKGELVMIILIGEDDSVHRYFVPTTAQPAFGAAMCVGTFQKADPRNIDTFINKEGLQGNFAVKVICDDKLYETGISISAK